MIRKYWSNTSGTSYWNLTGNPFEGVTAFANFPDAPDVVDYPTTYESYVNHADNYGQQMIGFITPTVTGDYTFYCTTDDGGALYVSTDESPAHKAFLAGTGGNWVGFRNYNGRDAETTAIVKSVKVHLVAGQHYYTEALQIEGGGGDNLSVAWTTANSIVDGAPPIPGSIVNDDSSVSYILSSSISTGPVSFRQPLADISKSQGQTAVFEARFDGDVPYTYQWIVNGAPVGSPVTTYTPYASMTVPGLTPANEGNTYEVDVSNQGGAATASSVGTLHVLAGSPPTLVEAFGGGQPDPAVSFDVTFDHPLDPTSAQTAGNYTLSGGIGVNSAALDADQVTVHVLAAAAVPNNTVVTVNGVSDFAGAVIAANSHITITITGGKITHNMYLNIGGGAVTDLTGNSRFPYFPDSSDFSLSGDSPCVNCADNYGQQMVGYINPPQSGTYYFWISSDDNSALYISPDENPSHKVLVAGVPEWTAVHEFNKWATQRSGGVSLTKGQRYYIEALQKEGGGGDNLSVGWTPTSWLASMPTVGIPGKYLSPFTAPPALGTVNPVDLNIVEFHSVTLQVDITGGAAPMSIQWYDKNNNPVGGANGVSFTTPLLHLADEPAHFYAAVSNPYGTVYSRTNTIHITPDHVAPTMVYANGVGKPDTTFDLLFSEPVDPSGATSQFSYTLSNGASLIADGVLDADQVTVHFTTDATGVTNGTLLTIAPGAVVADFAGNAIPVGTSIQIVVTDGFMRRNLFSADGGATDIPSLKADPNYPNAPTTVDFPTEYQSPCVNCADNYGEVMQGYITPPVDGNYTFAIAADDNAELWLSTDDNPLHKVLIARETSWSGQGAWHGNDGAVQISAPIPLQKGHRYYTEAYHKEGGGGDNIAVAWDYPALNGNFVNATFNGLLTTGGTPPIQGKYLSDFAALVTFDPALPADVTVPEHRSVTFTANELYGTAPSTIQWYRDGVAIPSANSLSYTLTDVTVLNDDGATFYLVGSNPLGDNPTRTATLHVIADVIPPTIVKAVGGAAPSTSITLTFSEPVDATTGGNALNYTVSGGITVSAAVVNGNKVVLTTSTQIEGALYTVTVSGVTDLSGNAIVPNTTVNYHELAFGPGALTWDVYSPLSTTDNGIATTLLVDPNYPDNPTSTFVLTHSNSRDAYPDDSHEGYGSRMMGAFVPPATGNWIFYLRSDDSSQLFLNATGTDPAGAVLIDEETGCCNGFKTHTSAPQALTGGQPYFIMALHKEGTGGDYVQVAAKLDTDLRDPDVANLIIPGGELGIWADPTGASVTISTEPVNKTVGGGLSASFTAAANTVFNGPNGPVANVYGLQWQSSRDSGITWSNIPFANSSLLSLPFVLSTDNGTKFRATVGVPGNINATSTVATLTVTTDITRPTMKYAVGHDGSSISVYYSEPVDPGTTDGFSYGIDAPLSISSGGINAGNPLRVDLTTDSPMTPGTVYTLTGTGVTDLSGNLTDPNPASVAFTYKNFSGDPDSLVALPTNTRLPIGSLTHRGFVGRLVQTGNSAFNNNNQQTEDLLNGIFPLQEASNLSGPQGFVEHGIINYNYGGNQNGRLLPDSPFPTAIVGGDPAYYGLEVMSYVELKAGVYSWGVASDDGFRVTAGTSVDDPNNSIVLGEFNGGRGIADSTFNFLAPGDGLYPIRLTYEEGTGGANVEFWDTDLVDGSSKGVNDNTGIHVWQPPLPAVTPGLSSSVSGANLVLTWSATGSIGYVLQGATDLTGTTWADTSVTMIKVGTSWTVTVPTSSAASFYRLIRRF